MLEMEKRERREILLEEKEQIFGNKENWSFSESNAAMVTGQIEKELELNHEIKHKIGEKTFVDKFYKTRVITRRLSGVIDFVPIIVHGKEMINMIRKGAYVKIEGQIRSYNYLGKDGLRHLEEFLFVKKLEVSNVEEKDINSIYLEGFICKPTNYRKTCLTKIAISDILIAVNGPYGRSDYIPCIAWGVYAKKAKYLNIGDKIRILGRFQSREYKKLLNSGELIEGFIAYELSIKKFEKI